jgi:hypothetical protein
LFGRRVATNYFVFIDLRKAQFPGGGRQVEFNERVFILTTYIYRENMRRPCEHNQLEESYELIRKLKNFFIWFHACLNRAMAPAYFCIV